LVAYQQTIFVYSCLSRLVLISWICSSATTLRARLRRCLAVSYCGWNRTRRWLSGLVTVCVMLFMSFRFIHSCAACDIGAEEFNEDERDCENKQEDQRGHSRGRIEVSLAHIFDNQLRDRSGRRIRRARNHNHRQVIHAQCIERTE